MTALTARNVDPPVIFALRGATALGEKIAAAQGLSLAPFEERNFEDGEHKLRPLVAVRDRGVFVIDALTGCGGPSNEESVNDRLIKCAFFIATLRQGGARRITLVAPYLCYARKDRQTKPRDPISIRFVAQLIEAMGADAIISVTAHDLAAFQNAFRIATIHLDTHRLFAQHLAALLHEKKVSVVSPDLGGAKRAELFRQTLEQTLQRPVGKAVLDKQRSRDLVTGEVFAGDVAEATALILDDMISTGETLIRAAAACRRNGAAEIFALATHGLFIGADPKRLQSAPIDRIVLTDSLPLRSAFGGATLAAKLDIVSLACLVADAIRIAHEGGSITSLLRGGKDEELA